MCKFIKVSFSICVFVIFLLVTSCTSKETKKVAFIGRYENPQGLSGSNEWYDTFVKNSLKSFLKDLNKKYKNMKIELEVFNIEQSPQKADSVYKVIAKDPEYIWVLDNSWGHDMVGAKETIINNRIPVLSINAYRGNNDYGPSVLFLLDYKKDIEYITAYAKKILNRDTVDFVSEDDVVFHRHFLEAFEKFNTTPTDTITYTGQQNINLKDSIKLFSSLQSHFEKHGKNDRVVLYNSHFMWGNQVLDYLNNTLSNSTFMSWSVPQTEYLQKLKNGNRVITNHRAYTSISEKVYKKYVRLMQIDSEHFSWTGSASLMEDFRNAIDILDNFISQHVSSNGLATDDINKENMVNYMYHIKNNVSLGSNEVFRFNSNGNLNHEKIFTSYSSEEGNSLQYQLNDNFEKIPAISFGVITKSINNIDINTSTFSGSFEYWLSGDSSARNSDKFISIKNLIHGESSIRLLQESYKNGNFLKRFVVEGQFYSSFAASQYPLDMQELNISVELLNPTDQIRVNIDPNSFNTKVEDLQINGWVPDDYYLSVDHNIHTEKLKNNRDYYKTQNVRVHYFVERNIWSSLLQIILPLFFIGIISIGILFLSNLSFSDLGEVIVGLFLSIIAFSISLAQLTPKFESLTKADTFFLLTFIVVFVIFIYLIIYNSRYQKKAKDVLKIFKWTLAILYPLIFLGIYFL